MASFVRNCKEIINLLNQIINHTSMKRIALLLLLLFPALKYISAQTFQAGFYVGASVSDIPGTDNIDNDVDFEHLGFVIAGTVSAKVSPKTNVQMEIRFIQK